MDTLELNHGYKIKKVDHGEWILMKYDQLVGDYVLVTFAKSKIAAINAYGRREGDLY